MAGTNMNHHIVPPVEEDGGFEYVPRKQKCLDQRGIAIVSTVTIVSTLLLISRAPQFTSKICGSVTFFVL